MKREKRDEDMTNQFANLDKTSVVQEVTFDCFLASKIEHTV